MPNELVSLAYQKNFPSKIAGVKIFSWSARFIHATKGEIECKMITTYKVLIVGWQVGEKIVFISDELKERMRNRTDWGKLLMNKIAVMTE